MPVMDLANGPRLTLYNYGRVQASKATYLIGRDRLRRPRLLSAVTRIVLSLSTPSHATELWNNWLENALPSGEGGNIALPWQYPIGLRRH